ncbi:MAG: hypothetical protein IPG83_02460 [Novosphingobium sp.]|nr:hypothetical protein [Novosphingobium sp.]
MVALITISGCRASPPLAVRPAVEPFAFAPARRGWASRKRRLRCNFFLASESLRSSDRLADFLGIFALFASRNGKGFCNLARRHRAGLLGGCCLTKLGHPEIKRTSIVALYRKCGIERGLRLFRELAELALSGRQHFFDVRNERSSCSAVALVAELRILRKVRCVRHGSAFS